jgi:hypothetical protein
MACFLSNVLTEEVLTELEAATLEVFEDEAAELTLEAFGWQPAKNPNDKTANPNTAVFLFIFLGTSLFFTLPF